MMLGMLLDLSAAAWFLVRCCGLGSLAKSQFMAALPKIQPPGGSKDPILEVSDPPKNIEGTLFLGSEAASIGSLHPLTFL